LLWALANEAGLTVDERIAVAAKARIDLEPIRARLEATPAAQSIAID
jgi:hypothetical protein